MPMGFGNKKEPAKSVVSEPARDDEAPGWDAINASLKHAFPGQEPIHWGTNRLPDQDGLYGLSAYQDGDDWFFITYGLTELFGKASDDPTTSGWGFELTMRVPATEAEPPVWPRKLLDKLGSYVFSSGRPFAAAHRFDFGEPITSGTPPSNLTCAAFAVDPQFGQIETPNGSVTFLTLVGITADELAEMKASTTAAVIDEMVKSNPRLVSDPRR